MSAAPRCDPLLQTYSIDYGESRRLGRGTDGFVIRAWHMKHRRWDALKYVRPDSYELELEVMKALGSHPHIVELLQAFPPFPGRRDAVLACSEAFCNLREFMRKGQRLGAISNETVDLFLRECLLGLIHCHQLGIIHRDLSPTNLLLDMVPGANAGSVSFSLRIADFGRARFIPSSAKRRRLTDKSFCDPSDRPVGIGATMTPHLGTRAYAAPECICAPWNEHFAYSTAVDVWSVGAIFFWALSKEELLGSSDSEAKMLATLWCRIGKSPEGLALGPRHQQIETAAESVVDRLRAGISTVTSYGDRGGWAGVREALQWSPKQRPDTKTLLNIVVAASRPALPDCARPESVAALAPTQGGMVPSGGREQGTLVASAPRQGTVAISSGKTASTLPDVFFASTSEQKLKTVKGQCLCSGHCLQPGHKSRRRIGPYACDSMRILAGCTYCSACVCILPLCLKPRHDSEMCSMHKKLFDRAPWPLRMCIYMRAPSRPATGRARDSLARRACGVAHVSNLGSNADTRPATGRARDLPAVLAMPTPVHRLPTYCPHTEANRQAAASTPAGVLGTNAGSAAAAAATATADAATAADAAAAASAAAAAATAAAAAATTIAAAVAVAAAAVAAVTVAAKAPSELQRWPWRKHS